MVDEDCPGGDYSLYFCDKCNRFVIASSNDDGDLVCSGCLPLVGLLYDAGTADQIDRARNLADCVDRFGAASALFLAPPKDYCFGGARRSLERGIEHLDRSASFGGDSPPQRGYLHTEDSFSFYFLISVYLDGKWNRDYNGGLIIHGPRVEVLPAGG